MAEKIAIVEKPRWSSREAAAIAGFEEHNIRLLRQKSGLRLGKMEGGLWKYSALDIAELTGFVALRSLGLGVDYALRTAKEFLRPNLRDLLVNRLIHGFWSLGAIEVPSDHEAGARVLYLDAIGERVISKLRLPLPVRPMPRTTEVAVKMVDACFDYMLSPPGLRRWKRWRESVVARGGKTSFDEAAAELGAPMWFLTALHQVTTGEVVAPTPNPAVVAAVKPHAAKASENLGGIYLR